MSYAATAWTGLLNDIATMNASRRANAAALADLRTQSGLVEELQQVRYDNAANIAEKCALREALARLDPRHPLLVDKSLQERIQQAGERALKLAGTWTAARDAGRSFKY